MQDFIPPSKFELELQELLNRHSMENESNTPDRILAQYLSNCLAVFNVATQRRDEWYGRDHSFKIDAAAPAQPEDAS